MESQSKVKSSLASEALASDGATSCRLSQRASHSIVFRLLLIKFSFHVINPSRLKQDKAWLISICSCSWQLSLFCLQTSKLNSIQFCNPLPEHSSPRLRHEVGWACAVNHRINNYDASLSINISYTICHCAFWYSNAEFMLIRFRTSLCKCQMLIVTGRSAKLIASLRDSFIGFPKT